MRENLAILGIIVYDANKVVLLLDILIRYNKSNMSDETTMPTDGATVPTDGATTPVTPEVEETPATEEAAA
ncbi:MAG TPA: hypothetical protein P5274_03310 [Candidatus Paceibacterota bacterium]|nr:hypothetical protein [Candidatus Paceibacterota bacterium]